MGNPNKEDLGKCFFITKQKHLFVPILLKIDKPTMYSCQRMKTRSPPPWSLPGANLMKIILTVPHISHSRECAARSGWMWGQCDLDFWPLKSFLNTMWKFCWIPSWDLTFTALTGWIMEVDGQHTQKNRPWMLSAREHNKVNARKSKVMQTWAQTYVTDEKVCQKHTKLSPRTNLGETWDTQSRTKALSRLRSVNTGDLTTGSDPTAEWQQPMGAAGGKGRAD